MRTRLTVLVLAALILAPVYSPHAASAQTPRTPEALLQDLFTSQLQREWFAPAFLAQVPLEQAQQIIDTYKQQLGPFSSVEKTGDTYTLHFERGSVRTTIVLSESGAITGFLLRSPQFTDRAAAFGQAVAAIGTLPGKVSLLVTRDGKDVEAKDAGARLAVGSTFKLAILAALQDQIAAGKHAWDEVVRLKAGWKSLPSGVLQDWPDGAPLTIQTLASQMISISDNTATDGLIEIVGREAIEKYAPGNDPLLTTHEAFTLKTPRYAGILERWRAANAQQRRSLLAEVHAQPFAAVAEAAGIFATTPTALDIEWFFSVRDLCGLTEKVGDNDVFAINPGGVDPAAWQRVAYKGGSEAGVLNLTYGLVSHAGAKICVSATWNDTSVEQDTLFGIVQQIIQGLGN